MKLLQIISVILLLFCFQKNMQAQNPVLLKSIEYDVPIINKDLCQGSELSETDWWKRNIETSKRLYFQQALLNKAIEGQIKVYDNNGNELSTTSVTKLLSYSDTVRMARNKPPYNFYDTVYTKYISPSEIQKIRFREAWYYDPKTFRIIKDIKSYSPLVAIDKTIKVQYKTKTASKDVSLFWIKCNNNSSSGSDSDKIYVTLTDYIQYNCPVYHNMQVVMPQFGNLVTVSNDTAQMKSYLNKLLYKIPEEQVKAYNSADFSDYYDYSIDSLITLSYKEFSNIVGPDTIMVSVTNQPYDENDTVIYKNLDVQNLTVFRFHEKWLLDPITMELQKEVMAVAPCEEVKGSGNSFKGIRPLFNIHFEKPNRCFKE